MTILQTVKATHTSTSRIVPRIMDTILKSSHALNFDSGGGNALRSFLSSIWNPGTAQAYAY